jgi:hypothetical protein
MALGSVVVKALCYKPEGRWFGTRRHGFFKFTLFFRSHQALGFTQPLTEMSRADNLTAIFEPIF